MIYTIILAHGQYNHDINNGTTWYKMCYSALMNAVITTGSPRSRMLTQGNFPGLLHKQEKCVNQGILTRH